MTASEAAKRLGLKLYEEFSISVQEGTLRFTSTMLELKVDGKWGPVYVQKMLIDRIVEGFTKKELKILKNTK